MYIKKYQWVQHHIFYHLKVTSRFMLFACNLFYRHCFKSLLPFNVMSARVDYNVDKGSKWYKLSDKADIVDRYVSIELPPSVIFPTSILNKRRQEQSSCFDISLNG